MGTVEQDAAGLRADEAGDLEDDEFEEADDTGYEDGDEDEGDVLEPGEARWATPEDAEELTRLRAVMLEGMGPVLDDAWRAPCVDAFRTALSDPDGPMQAFVVDAPDRPGVLASCSVGMIQQRLPSVHNPIGMTGYILNVATDPGYRRRGHARTVVNATLEWLRECGIERVDLHSSPDAEPLYRELGFHEPRATSLTLWLNR